MQEMVGLGNLVAFPISLAALIACQVLQDNESEYPLSRILVHTFIKYTKLTELNKHTKHTQHTKRTQHTKHTLSKLSTQSTH